MKICKIPAFQGKTVNYKDGRFKIKDSFDDDNILQSHVIYDEFGRDVVYKRFDENGFITASSHKEYYETGIEKGYIETYKDESQEYVRKSYTKTENGQKHRVEEFISKSSPQNSYINDFVYDLKGNLCKLINNGKEIIFKCSKTHD